MSDIVERLRSGNTHNNQTWFEMCCEAAYTITDLRAQLAAAKAEKAELVEALKLAQPFVDQAADEDQPLAVAVMMLIQVTLVKHGGSS